MSTGSETTLLLKAAPEAEQIADRLDGGPWQGIELCLAGAHIDGDDALQRTIETARRALPEGLAVTAEAPVAWPSGAHVRVDRLDDEARAGIERSARFAAAIGSPVLTIHLFIPMTPGEFRRGEPVHEPAVEDFLRCFAGTCLDHGVTPLIENVPPVLRMRSGGFFLSPIGGHWRDLVTWGERVVELGYTLDTSHAALFRNLAAAYPTLFGLTSDEGLELERYVEELGPRTDVAHVSDAAGLLGEGLNYGEGELDLDPVVRRLGELVPFIVAEINEPDHARSPNMKAGYKAIARALAQPTREPRRPRIRPPAPEPFDWRAVIGQDDPVPAVLELEAAFAGRRILITGGCGSIGRHLATLLDGLRPERVTVLDAREDALTGDRRMRAPDELSRMDHVLCDVRDASRIRAEIERAAPDAIFHLAACKHVDLAERFPEEFVATNLEGSWNVLGAAEHAGVETVVVASTDKAALATSLYGRTKRMMEQLTALSAERAGGRRAAVRLVNVLGSAGSASDLFLRQARAGGPLTVTDPDMERYWITMAHATTLIAHAALLGDGTARLLSAADPVTMTVGELAERIWRQTGHPDEPAIALLGVRPGEVMREVLTGPGEQPGDERFQGCAPIEGAVPTGGIAELVAAVERAGSIEERRARWLAGLREMAAVETDAGETCA